MQLCMDGQWIVWLLAKMQRAAFVAYSNRSSKQPPPGGHVGVGYHIGPHRCSALHVGIVWASGQVARGHNRDREVVADLPFRLQMQWDSKLCAKWRTSLVFSYKHTKQRQLCHASTCQTTVKNRTLPFFLEAGCSQNTAAATELAPTE